MSDKHPAEPDGLGDPRPWITRISLSQRLVFVAAVWLTLALVVAGLVLVALYRDASERAFDDRLDVYLKAIVGEIGGGSPGEPAQPGNLGDPRFTELESGWYWMVFDGRSNELLFASLSLFGDHFDLPDLPTSGRTSSYVTSTGGIDLRVLQSRIVFGQAEVFRVVVAGNTRELRSLEAAYAWQVGLTLLVVGAGLIAAIVFQVRIGLKPLTTLRHSLSAVRRGDAQAVDEALPPDLLPLARELNALVRSNRDVVERARTHVGNLAHALKTPLSVIVNEVRSGEGADLAKIDEQSGVMKAQVHHHLEQARLAAQRRVIGVSSSVEPATARLVRAMSKIHGDRNLAYSLEVPPGLLFRGEEHDLEEMAGNLIDNASKWTKTKVDVRVKFDKGRSDRFILAVEDDGPGLTEDERREALKRGRRLDETVPGTGLGLAIVVDLAAVYGGELTLKSGEQGVGLRAELSLPALDRDETTTK